MKLLHCQTLEVDEFSDLNVPPYAVLSHIWETDGGFVPSHWACNPKLQKRLPIHQNVLKACQETKTQGIAYLWVDSLCIDTSSIAEVDEAVNASFRWLRRSAVCLVYLHDLPPESSRYDEIAWARCSYWKQAWTLQELIAPPRVEFFDVNWRHCGSKASPELLPILANITRVPEKVLIDCDALLEIPLGVRFSWAAECRAGREEDTAYSLLGISGVNMSIRYGEGADRAFLRLQKEILRNTRDGSIFAWRSTDRQEFRGLLARSPSEFRHFATAPATAQRGPWIFDGDVRTSSRGLEIQAPVFKCGPYIMMEIARPGPDAQRVGVYLLQWNGICIRAKPDLTSHLPAVDSYHCLHIAYDLEPRTSFRISQEDPAEHDNQFSLLAASESWPCFRQNATSSIGSECVASNLAPTKRDGAGQPRSSDNELEFDAAPLTFDSPIPSDDGTSFLSEDTEDSASGDESVGTGQLQDNESQWPQETSLNLDPKFQDVRTGLVLSAYENAQAWMACARYIEPPKHRLAPRKRARTATSKPRSVFLEEEDPQDSNVIIVSRIDGYFHLACPFYAIDPNKYQQCLLEHDLRSIEAVISHLRRYHMQPPYCPTCRRTFTGWRERDAHIYARSCTLRERTTVEGITEQQRVELVRQEDPGLDDEMRWYHLYGTIFPDRKTPQSPYLRDGVGFAVSQVLDFWSQNGRRYISDHLPDFRLHPGDQSAMEHLFILTREDLVRKVFQNHLA